MLKTYLLVTLLALALSLVSGAITIPLLKKLRIGQPILKYVENHKDKSGTPTMGGLFFIISACIIFMTFGGLKSRLSTVSMAIGLVFMLVGFLDDFIKIKFRKNEGLKAYQKILFQTSIALVAGFFAYYNGLTVFFVPFSTKTVDLGWFTIIFVAIIFIAITNSVNLTDGLDGLAGSTSTVYLTSIALLIYVQTIVFGYFYLPLQEFSGLTTLCCALIGAILGFLIFNASKASVFMGDSGSLSLGGFIGAISIFSLNAFYIPIIGFTFVFSSLSVIIQVAYFKRTKKRVFLMTPFHHHLQLKGLSECKISYLYSLITGILGVLSIIFYV